MHALLVVPAAQFEELDQALDGVEDDWSWAHAGSAAAAIEKLQGTQRFDVVVSDLALVGSEWLNEVAERSPVSARLVLMDTHESAPALAAAAIAHQCLGKPYSADRLQSALASASRWRSHAGQSQIYDQLTRLRTVPTLPRTHRELMQELQAEEPNLAVIAEIVADDPAMSAKLLQLINSPYFGVREEITNIKQAVLLLGLDLLRDLSTSYAVFQAFTGQVEESLLEHLWRESHVVAALVDRLSRHLELEGAVRGDLRVAAFIHEIGRLALLALDVRAYAPCIDMEGEALIAAERERYGIDHAMAGAYLLSLWGLPERLVQCVYHHHRAPSEPAQWCHGWIVGLAALLVQRPIEQWEPALMSDWCALSGLEAVDFARVCRDASGMVHGA